VLYTAEQIARVCHEANRALQAVQGDPGVPVSPAWDDDTDEQRATVTAGVGGVLAGNTPEESHAAWCKAKRANGWRYGPVKDSDARTHPCLVDYDELPEHQRVKDHLFAAIVDVLGAPDLRTTDDVLYRRHPGVAAVARFLLDVNPSLPQPLARIAHLHRVLAVALLDELIDGPELTAALRKLLEAKDCAVRAALPV
jgi:hypothetical protein